MVSESIVNEIKERIVIEDIIKDYVQLKHSGRNYVCCCPFHKEKTPSFFVFPDKNCFKCFGCGEAGDAISFIRKIENLDFVETMKFLAEKYGIKIHDDDEENYQYTEHHKKESALIILDYVKKFLYSNTHVM